MLKNKLLLVPIICAFIFAGCKKNDLAAFQPEILNIPDSFSLQATGLDKVSDNLTYTWSNSGTVANIDQSSVISEGTATLTIEDAQGTEVYTKDLSVDGSFTSSTGVSGNWTITVDLSKVKGDLNFTVQ
ncbi:MAG: hypothetical protein ACJASQ_002548 [Crocinitomicaceae bacterium]|jgi:hypothetical protein